VFSAVDILEKAFNFCPSRKRLARPQRAAHPPRQRQQSPSSLSTRVASICYRLRLFKGGNARLCL